MGSARQVVVQTAITGALFLAFPRSSHSGADDRPVTADRIIYGKDDALWSMASDGSDSSILVSLGRPAADVSRIKVAASGTAMLVSIAGYQAWADLSSPTEPTTLHYLPCGGGLSTSPDISADGSSVVCATLVGERVAIYQMRSDLNVTIVDRPANGPVFFAGANKDGIAFGDQNNLISIRDGSVLSPHRPNRSMVATPNGKRVIGAYNETDIDIVYSFRLDGRATKRTLMQAAQVVSVSASSEWAALQQEVDACAVRISGGQYMCWRKFEALDISSRALSLLLSRRGEKTGRDLFLGSIRGTRARKPTPLAQSIDHAAAFWPAAQDISSPREAPAPDIDDLDTEDPASEDMPE